MLSTVYAAGSAQTPHQGPAMEQRRPRFLEDPLQIPQFRFPVLHRRRLTDLIDRAARHRVALVCGPGGAGKTVACAAWAAAQREDRQVVWLSLNAGEDNAWFWAGICAGLTRARAVPSEAMGSLEDVSADDFPLRLVEMMRLFPVPMVLVLDNAHLLIDGAVLAGLERLIRHAPPTLCLFLSGRRPPGLRLERLQASGELGVVGAASLACTPDEVDAYRALLCPEADATERDELPEHAEGLIGGLRLFSPAGSRP
jgi:LuxR family transcriptional regulator, maltose regulon positive regulatory protein